VLHKKSTYIGELLEDVADRFAFQLNQRGIQIAFTVDPYLKINPIQVDSDKLDQVLDNLVSNASKFSHDSGKIEMSAIVNQKKWIEIAVKDSGIGIPSTDLPRIFDRFFRVEKARSRNRGGTGLGLSISREIVRAHGGQIFISSELNQGTTVRFTLPIDNQDGSEPL
jgi:two-component system sensor histidine kinase VicK